ncbi:MAG: hypothetical protein M3Q33_09070 [Acidobacteriota bacterium]|nr:hypothetical protein [Acidobacteriota bacterium]
MGEVTIENNSKGQNYIVINGENVLSGRSIMSPASIVTPLETSAQISLAKTGIIKLAPNSTLNLFFEDASISGDLWSGKLTLNVLPNTKLNILTPDGIITNSDLSQETVATIDFVDSKVRLQTLTGEVMFNNVKVAAGQTFPAQQNSSANTNAGAQTGGAGSSKLILITLAIVGAVAIGALVGLSGGDNDNSSPVSPTR